MGLAKPCTYLSRYKRGRSYQQRPSSSRYLWPNFPRCVARSRRANELVSRGCCASDPAASAEGASWQHNMVSSQRSEGNNGRDERRWTRDSAHWTAFPSAGSTPPAPVPRLLPQPGSSAIESLTAHRRECLVHADHRGRLVHRGPAWSQHALFTLSPPPE